MQELPKHEQRYAPLNFSEVITGSTIASNIAQVQDGAVFKFKAELRKMTNGELLKIVLNQKERKCVLGGVCRFLLEYRRILFCVSEILGQGCQVERQRLDSGQDAQSEGGGARRAKERWVKIWLTGFQFDSGPGFSQR